MKFLGIITGFLVRTIAALIMMMEMGNRQVYLVSKLLISEFPA